MGEKEREIRGLRDRILEGRWSEDTDIAGGDGVLVENQLGGSQNEEGRITLMEQMVLWCDWLGGFGAVRR